VFWWFCWLEMMNNWQRGGRHEGALGCGTGCCLQTCRRIPRPRLRQDTKSTITYNKLQQCAIANTSCCILLLLAGYSSLQNMTWSEVAVWCKCTCTAGVHLSAVFRGSQAQGPVPLGLKGAQRAIRQVPCHERCAGGAPSRHLPPVCLAVQEPCQASSKAARFGFCVWQTDRTTEKAVGETVVKGTECMSHTLPVVVLPQFTRLRS
jgi:hypothetical protein